MEGIKKAAEVFSLLQETRIELIDMGAKNNDHQDLRLGQMLEDGKNAMKHKFEKITLE